MKKILFFFSFIILCLTGCNDDQNPQPNGSGEVNLSVRVVDVYTDPIEGAEVFLYENQSDYQGERNPVNGKMTTDQNGMAYYYTLQAKPYFIRIQKGGLNNRNGNTTTPELRAGNNNYTFEIN